MSSVVKNVKSLPEVFYGLHMAEGVAEYREPGKDAYRIFLNEETCKKMDPTFRGRPVFVHHVDEVNLDTLQQDADGYVVESFWNKSDGKHWVKFMVISDKGKQAIRNGWQLSNAYLPKSFANGGLWHGVEYSREVVDAEYEHLAIVNDPRYSESRILTPEQFKEYCAEKEFDLQKVANSKQGVKSVLSFFKKQKVDSVDLENTLVKLPKSGSEVSLAQIVNAMDDMEEKKKKENTEEGMKKAPVGESEGDKLREGKGGKDEAGYEKDEPKKGEAPAMANGEHHVMVGEEKMKVNDLVAKHMKMHDCMKNMKNYMSQWDDEVSGQPGEGSKSGEMKNDHKEASEIGDENSKKSIVEMADDQLKAVAKKANEAEEDKPEQPKVKKNSNFETLEKAPFVAQDIVRADLDKMERGKQRYGSN